MKQRLLGWPHFLATVLLTGALLASIAPAFERWLPEPYRSYVPMHDHMWRIEAVWQDAVPAEPGCIVFVGDSRLAFQVETARLASPECPRVRNYGFPALPPEAIAAFISDRIRDGEKPRTAVLVINEILFRNDLTSYSGDVILLPLVRRALSNRTARRLLLGYRRIGAFLAGRPPPSNGWDWSPDIGRWVWRGLDQRVVHELPSRDAELVAMADDYYRGRTLRSTAQAELVDLVGIAAGYAERVVIILPPQHPGMRARATAIQTTFREWVHSLAAQGVAVMDCMDANNCGLPAAAFADPVHLNGAGISAFTMQIKQRLGI